jgi:hypothetical protein
MAWWLVGDEEHDDRRFLDAGPGALELYVRAGSWVMAQVRYRPSAEVPEEWFIPVEWVKGQHSGIRLANKLVEQGVFVKVFGGYGFRHIHPQNTPDAVRKQRNKERDKKRNAKAKTESYRLALVPDSPRGHIRGNRR